MKRKEEEKEIEIERKKEGDEKMPVRSILLLKKKRKKEGKINSPEIARAIIKVM